MVEKNNNDLLLNCVDFEPLQKSKNNIGTFSNWTLK